MCTRHFLSPMFAAGRRASAKELSDRITELKKDLSRQDLQHDSLLRQISTSQDSRDRYVNPQHLLEGIACVHVLLVELSMGLICAHSFNVLQDQASRRTEEPQRSHDSNWSAIDDDKFCCGLTCTLFCIGSEL